VLNWSFAFCFKRHQLFHLKTNILRCN
jgi:hypothetical protein